MKIKHIILGICIGLAVGIGLVNYSFKTQKVYSPRITKSQIEKQTEGIAGALEWYNQIRNNPVTGRIEQEDFMLAIQQVQALSMQKNKGMGIQWIEMGPDNVGGRTRALLFDKDNPNLMFSGGVSGGLWRSETSGLSWVRINDSSDVSLNIAVSAICQTKNGNIFYGTGERFGVDDNAQNHVTYGAPGVGIYKSKDKGRSFELLTSTQNIKYVYDMVAHPTENEKVYAATFIGLCVSNDGGATWTKPIPGSDKNVPTPEVVIASDGTVASIVNNRLYISDGADVFTRKTNFPSGNFNRIELAFAPSDPNYLYAVIAKNDNTTEGIYRSTDKGETWTCIGVGSPQFNPLGTQGHFDNCIAVYPNNKNKIMVGGQSSLWIWEQGKTWEAITYTHLSQTSPKWVHADHHVIRFHPLYNGLSNKIIFVGTDGGIFRSTDGGKNWAALNKNYNVTQYFSFGFSGDGRIIGGTQDNGTQYITLKGNTIGESIRVKGGDGGDAEISVLVPNAVFGTTYYGSVCRSNDKVAFAYLDSKYFYSQEILNKYFNQSESNIGNISSAGSFVTPIALWESFYDTCSTDSVEFTADKTYYPGNVIYINSKIGDNKIFHVLTYKEIGDSLKQKSKIKIQDHFQAMLAVGFKHNVWITRRPLDFSTTNITYPTVWHPLINEDTLKNIGNVEDLAFSKDGNYLYFSTANVLYRVSNLLRARDSLRIRGNSNKKITSVKAIFSSNLFITDIAVDPNDANKVLLTMGNYYNAPHVYYSTNATSDNPIFVSKQGNLPGTLPIFSGCILMNGGDTVLLGTEYGIYATTSISATTPVWTEENINGMARVPVFQIRQQIHPNGWHPQANINTRVTNSGFIYVATHGRGIFRTEMFKGPVGIKEIANKTNNQIPISVFPNPTINNVSVSFTILKNNSNIDIRIYDLQGKLVLTNDLKNQPSGNHTLMLNTEHLPNGNYLIMVADDKHKSTAKFIKY